MKQIINLTLKIIIALLISRDLFAQDYSSVNKEFKDCEVCPVMVKVAGGTYTMGRTESEGKGNRDELPPHKVEIKAFSVGKYEVTVREFKAFIKESNYITSAEKNNPLKNWLTEFTSKNEVDSFPVVYVALNDAQSYAEWLSHKTDKQYRLLTEEEFEYVLRAGTQTRYWWGDSAEDACIYENLSVYGKCSERAFSLKPVGSFKPNNWGIYDLAGNVSELTSDCFGRDYQGLPGSYGRTEEYCEDISYRGSDSASDIKEARSAARAHINRLESGYNLGFRIAVSA